VCLLALVPAGCAPTAQPVELSDDVALAGAGSVTIHVLLQPEHGRYRQRYMRGAASAVEVFAATFGRFDHVALELDDPAWAPSSSDESVAAEPRFHWWTTSTAFQPELAAARAVVRRGIDARFGRSAVPHWFLDGVAEWVARRAVVPLFEKENLPPGFAFIENRYFDAFVPRFARIRLPVDTAGWPVAAYRRNPAAAPVPVAAASDRAALAGKTILALGTLEQWLGQPTLNAVMAGLFEQGDNAGLPQFERLASAASGQDLTWFFEPVFHSAARFDYAIGAHATRLEQDGSFITTVTVERKGDATFTGSNAPRVGPYDRGLGIALQVTFADGQTRIDRWDGRDPRRTFRYRSPASATTAVVDPEHVVLLDIGQTNNSATFAEPSSQPLEWAARFLMWLSDALVTYAALV